MTDAPGTNQPGTDPPGTDPAWQDRFVEDAGALGPGLGIPRAMMRVNAWMMVCQPPEQSAQDIEDRLRLSAGSVNTALRQLIAAGMIERFFKPGERRAYFRIASGSWVGPLEAQLRGLARFRQIAETGIAAAGPAADFRLTEMRDAFAWFEQQLAEHLRSRRP